VHAWRSSTQGLHRAAHFSFDRHHDLSVLGKAVVSCSLRNGVWGLFSALATGCCSLCCHGSFWQGFWQVRSSVLHLGKSFSSSNPIAIIPSDLRFFTVLFFFPVSCQIVLPQVQLPWILWARFLTILFLVSCILSKTSSTNPIVQCVPLGKFLEKTHPATNGLQAPRI